MLLKPLSIATLCVLFSLMFIGAYVSSSGVGLSCPKWPLCPAGLIPMKEFVIEYIHRTVAAITAVLVFATTFFTLRSKLTSQNVKIASIIAAALALGQIALGGIVIFEKLHAVLVTVHLGMGLILFAMVLMVVKQTFELDKVRVDEVKVNGASKIPDNK
jgi:heme A synthase